MKKIAILNGVNMDRLGIREPGIYGDCKLSDLIGLLREEAKKLGVEIVDFQTNYEGAMVEMIAELADSGVKLAVINPAAFTHTSVALRDSMAGSGIRFVEVHISNIFNRENFRRESLTAPVCDAVVAGMGFEGYAAALRYLSKFE